MAQRAQRLMNAAKNSPLPEGTYAVGAGLIIAGISAYGFQILSARELSDTEYAALNSLWAIVFVVAPGFFQPLEQEVSRALAHRRANRIGGGPLVRRAAILGAILAGSVGAVALIFGRRLVDDLFHGETLLLLALLIGLASYYMAHTTRGTLSGNGRFRPYGMMHGSEGIIRLTFCVVLFAAGVGTPWLYALALVLPPFGAIAIALRGQHGLMPPGPVAPYSELSSALSLLLLGSVLAQLLSYASFLAANILATPSEKASVGLFITGLFIARIPILLFQAVQAALLPKLAGLAGEGRHDDFRGGMRKLVLIVIALGILGTIAAATIGPFVGELLFGQDKFILGHRDLALLAAGSGFFILALTLAQGLIALRGYATAAISWMVGIIAFVAVTAVVHDLFLRVELGYVAGTSVAAFAMGLALLARMRAGSTARGLEELVENIPHEPLEI